MHRFCGTSNALFFTAHIRRMREGNSFTLCVSPHLDRGGYYLQAGGGYPLPRSRWGVLPCQVWGYYLARWGVLPCQAGGYYLPRGYYLQAGGVGGTTSRRGVLLPAQGYYLQAGGYYLQTGGTTSRGGVLPPGMYLVHGGWYTSCVHAGGLSCSNQTFGLQMKQSL